VYTTLDHANMGNSIGSYFTEDEEQDILDFKGKSDYTAWESTVTADPRFSAERQQALQSKLGLSSPDMTAVLEQSEFISLGSHCRVAMALENMGLRKSAYPFDWVRSSAEGVLKCLETDFDDFLSWSDMKRDKRDNKYFFGTSWGGSFWHHDIEDSSVCETFHRRTDRLLGRGESLQGLKNRFFVRVANSPQELALAPKLLAAMQRKNPQVKVFLVVLIDMQKHVGLVRAENTSNNLVFYNVHEDLWLKGTENILEQRHRIADTYAVGIGAALRYFVQGDKAQAKPVVVPDIAILYRYTTHFDGGDCTKELYRPQRLREPVYLKVPENSTPGLIKTRCFGKDVQVFVNEGCSAGAQLEMRLSENLKDVSFKVKHAESPR